MLLALLATLMDDSAETSGASTGCESAAPGIASACSVKSPERHPPDAHVCVVDYWIDSWAGEDQSERGFHIKIDVRGLHERVQYECAASVMVVIPVDGVSELDPVDRVVEQHVYFSQVDVALSHGGGSGIGKDGIVVGFLWKTAEVWQDKKLRLHVRMMEGATGVSEDERLLALRRWDVDFSKTGIGLGETAVLVSEHLQGPAETKIESKPAQHDASDVRATVPHAVRLAQAHTRAIVQMIEESTAQVQRHEPIEANLRDLRRVLARLVCVNESSLTPTGSYCLYPQDPPVFLGPNGWQLGMHHFPADSGLVGLLQPIFHGRSVLDLGCGCGQYGAVLTEIDYRGFDGALNVEDFTGGHVRWADLSMPLDADSADFVMLLEVGEHLPAEHEDQVLNNAAGKTRCGLVLSWGVPWHTGAFHVNLRSNRYIRDKLRSRGFSLDVDLTREGRERCQHTWFRDTFMFFWKDDAPQHCYSSPFNESE